MNTFKDSIAQIFTGAFKAFRTYPATIGFSMAFTIITLIRVQMDWSTQESYNFLFNSLHLSLAFGAVFSLAAITGAKSHLKTSKAFFLANILSLAVVVVTFLLLYFTNDVHLSGIAVTRISMAMLVSMLSFVLLSAQKGKEYNISKSLFMTQKAFFIALVYGVVILSGTSAVAGAFQALLYREMSFKVYQYISTLVGFLTVTIFVGFFPDFSELRDQSRRLEAESQPRFIEILFNRILVPLVLAMTVVLLLWTVRMLISDDQISFLQLSSIATSYSIGGIWLHIMISDHTSKIAQFYRKAYPFAALLILAFQAYALLDQLVKFGLKTSEYFFSLIWLAAVIASILLILKKSKSHIPIVLVICLFAFVSVFPSIGYHALPVKVQISRLENQLVDHGILINNQLRPASNEPDSIVKESISKSISFLASAEGASLPPWFDTDLNQSQVFKEKLGFEQTWTDYSGDLEPRRWVSLMLPPDPIDIEKYTWALTLDNFQGRDATATSQVSGRLGTYKLVWTANRTSSAPRLQIFLNEIQLIDQDMTEHVDTLLEKYLDGPTNAREAELEDMVLELETEEIQVLLVFNNVELSVDPENDSNNYWIHLRTLYFREK